MVSSKPGLLHKAMSGSVALQKPGSELMSRTPVVPEGHAEDQGLVGYLGHGYDVSVQEPATPGAMLMWLASAAT